MCYCSLSLLDNGIRGIINSLQIAQHSGEKVKRANQSMAVFINPRKPLVVHAGRSKRTAPATRSVFSGVEVISPRHDK